MFELDRYTIKARLYPSFLVLLTPFVVSIFYITDIEKYYHYFTALISVGLFTFLLSQLGRDKGKSKEGLLYNYFGGKPTIQILRHSDQYLDRVTKQRYHKLLEQKIQELKIPTTEEEKVNRKYTDEVYESCGKYLISKTRDTKKYNLLFKENISYGFRRNLWGMKAWALIILLLSLLIHLYFSTAGFTVFNQFKFGDIALLVYFFIAGFFWIAIVTKNWIKIPAFAYAEKLYETLNED